MPVRRYDQLDAGALARLTGAPLVELRDSVGSVLDVAHELGQHNAAPGTLVLAEEQTDGRGRAGRTWHSPRGAGIWLAVLVRPAETPAGGALAIRAGLAVVESLWARSPALGAALKWPNDVMVLGRKAGGILCEARWTGPRLGWVAIGVGLNVKGPVDERVQGSAIALADVDASLTRAAVLEELVPRLVEAGARPAALTPDERVTFLRRLFLPPGTGTVVGLEPDGALLVRRPNGSLERRTIPD